MHTHRPHPHLAIPPGARPLPAVDPNPMESYTPYAFELNSPAGNLADPWETTPTANHPSARLGVPRSRSRTRSAYEAVAPATIPFPEPEIYRSSSQRSTLNPQLARHRTSKSDSGHSQRPLDSDTASSSSAPYTPASASSESSIYFPSDDLDSNLNQLTRELSTVSLQSEEGLRRFQAGTLSDRDEEWHHMVPPEAREALGKREVERQSVFFEVFKSERDYVSDLQLVKDVFIEPLRVASPPVIAPERLRKFISEVFWNMNQLLDHHTRMLGSLFARQADQHPLVQSVTDIFLETSFLFCGDYESYIKHYPLAEELHRTELKRNPRYQAFIQQCSLDPRISKRDLLTFLSRPVTRLPRMRLILEHVEKLTEPDHPDKEDLPILLSILGEFLKSTQPGIAAAESKVKFWNLCESLVFMSGEIIDIDWYDESRSLIHSGTLARRSKSDMEWSHSWNDLFVALLDNYLLLMREEKRPGGVIKRLVVSRPLPLEYLRLGDFDAPAESRKERSEDGGILDSLRAQYKPVYPFTVYHASAKAARRYTLYAATEQSRKRWKEALIDCKAVHDARRDGNKWFALQTVNDGFFRSPSARMAQTSLSKASGRMVNAVSFTAMGGKTLMAVGCATGIYVGVRGEDKFRKILSFTSPTSIIALQDFNKFIVHHENWLISYSLDLLARVALYQAPPSSLDASLEKIAGQDGNVVFCSAGRIGQRSIIAYAVKTFLQVTVHVAEAAIPTDLRLTPQRSTPGVSLGFRPFGDPLYVPKDAYNVTPLAKTIAISTEKGIVVADPTNPNKSVVAVVPDFGDATSNGKMTDLKARCEAAKPLGLIRCDATELLVVYDSKWSRHICIGCFITKHGSPSRSCGFIRWESKATSFAHRGAHLLLFSSDFIEIRNVSTGRLVQVIEGTDIRLLLHTNLRSQKGNDPLLVALRGDKNDRDGISDKIVELVETSEIAAQTPVNPSTAMGGEGVWDEWDM
ncbi:hypothetical protein BJ138DRAFT_1113504 [Hygrophoropsis aurantiaca]|uniref:Uncharacterized protein n=1 Tax=Hygrophoropsis aurantiaca TaxID=72124 RepID=A0ACB8ACU1_9AGAM|nr:hypothetical protein BJ138DRAFT_1113504 [Hygrophoropsis aurantiaca]